VLLSSLTLKNYDANLYAIVCLFAGWVISSSWRRKAVLMDAIRAGTVAFVDQWNRSASQGLPGSCPSVEPKSQESQLETTNDLQDWVTLKEEDTNLPATVKSELAAPLDSHTTPDNSAVQSSDVHDVQEPKDLDVQELDVKAGLKTLQEMGFEHHAALQALHGNRADLTQAVQCLIRDEPAVTCQDEPECDNDETAELGN
jgi:hypothetical protein